MVKKSYFRNVYAKKSNIFTYVSFITVVIFICVGFIHGVFFYIEYFFSFASGNLPLCTLLQMYIAHIILKQRKFQPFMHLNVSQSTANGK